MFRVLNRTTNQVALVPVQLADGREQAVVVAKATYELDGGASLRVARDPDPVRLVDEHHGEPGQSSVRAEAETAPEKLGGEVTMVGEIVAPARAGAVDLRLQVGSLVQRLRIWGDRVWEPRGAGYEASAPAPFERMPLRYERAFGGRDPRTGAVDPRNPVGVGFLEASQREGVAGLPLPNIEDPDQLLRAPFERPPPAGFGVVARSWLPRRELASASDVDPRFFSAAPLGLQASRPFEGGEPIRIEGARPGETIAFALPRQRLLLEASVARRRAEAAMQLDTLRIDLDRRRLELVYRGAIHCPRSIWYLEWVRVAEAA